MLDVRTIRPTYLVEDIGVARSLHACRLFMYLVKDLHFLSVIHFFRISNYPAATIAGTKFRYTNVRRVGDNDEVEKQPEPYHSNAKVRMDNHPLMIMAEQE